MKLVSFAVAAIVVLLATIAPSAAQSERSTGCATLKATIVKEPQFSLPEGTVITSPFVAFDLDLGADGRVRDLHTLVGSGNAMTDKLLRSALQNATYSPAEAGCLAVSSVYRFVTNTQPPPSPAPASEDQRIALPHPAAFVDTCTPLVDTFVFPVRRDRTKRGTALVAVPIDASGAIEGPPKLEKSTGSPTLDTEAVRVATTGKYRFMTDDPCRAASTTYLLELRFY